jgi:DnaK suppressor protein
MNTESFKARLAEEKQKLEAELATVGRRNPANPGDWEAVPQETELAADPADVASEIAGFEDNAGIVKELEARLIDVNAALGRIEDGSYGKCKVGGEEIEEARLNADPAAATCIAHK